MDSLWIKSEILNWSFYTTSSFQANENYQYRAYEIWGHAEALLANQPNDFQRTDAITTLKRAFNQRLKFIEYIYEFRKLSNSRKPLGYLELLETFGLVRPVMFKKLLLIRNDIEHNDTAPPNTERCEELLDFVWYFLKSTDSILSNIGDTLDFKYSSDEGGKSQYGYELTIDYEMEHSISIRGWFPEDSVFHKPEPHYIEVKLEKVKKKKDCFPDNDYHKDKLDDDLYIYGSLSCDDEIKTKIVKLALSKQGA